jgi:hypothetical protein
MASGAEARRAVSETDSRGILNIMYTMTIYTGGNVGIVFLGQCFAVYTIFILIVNGTVALGTRLRDVYACSRGELAALLTGQSPLRVGIMAVTADGGVDVACIESPLMNAILG